MKYYVPVDALLNFSIEAETAEAAQQEAMRLVDDLLGNFDNENFENYQAFTTEARTVVESEDDDL